MAPVQAAVYRRATAARKPREDTETLEDQPQPGNNAERRNVPRWTEPVPPPSSWGATGPANARREPANEPNPAAPPPPPATPPGARAPLALLAGVAGISAILGGVIAGAGVVYFADGDDNEAADGDSTVQPLSVEQTSAIAEAASLARPSVVRIESTKRVAGGSEQDVGSGVVLDAEGHILTNAHVVLGTDSLKVILADGTERPAVVIGHDYPFTDLAVLQIGPGKLTPIQPGDAATLRLGESVVAIGNPLAEFDGSVSVGVVSGINRVRTFDGVRQADLIQTDVAINNGNSGGALVNLRGQFVGMPTAVIRQSRAGNTVEGIAFALPSGRLLEIAEGIIRAGGQYPRPSIQAEHVDLTPEVLAKLSRSTVKDGALIASVTPGGAAAEAGIGPGDVITQVGDTPITSDMPLYNAIMEFKPGDSAKVVLNCNGWIIEIEVRFVLRS